MTALACRSCLPRTFGPETPDAGPPPCCCLLPCVSPGCRPSMPDPWQITPIPAGTGFEQMRRLDAARTRLEAGS